MLFKNVMLQKVNCKEVRKIFEVHRAKIKIQYMVTNHIGMLLINTYF